MTDPAPAGAAVDVIGGTPGPSTGGTPGPSTGGTPGPSTGGAAGAAGPSASAADRDSWSARRRRWTWPAVAALAVLAVSALTALLARTETRDDLDPRSAAPGGTRAVAEILRRQGVQVDLVTRSDAAVAGAGTGTAIVLVRPALLGPEQLKRLRDTTADLVLVEPDLITLATLAPAITATAAVPARPAVPGCDDADAVASGTVTGGGRQYSLTRGRAPEPDVTIVGCYPDRTAPDRFTVIRIIDGDRRITVLGQREVLQNQNLVSDGNAALALRLLGARPALRWYLPDPAELGQTGRPPTLSELLPPWVGWVLWQLVVASAVLLVWRGRRLGRVITEPLPVVVRSAETVEGRARLYRTGRARGRAAAVLRTAAVRRLASRLGVPPDAQPGQVAALAAQATRRDPVAVHALLLGEAPRDDAALVALAAQLDAVEREVAASGGGAGGYGGPAQDHRDDQRRHRRPDPEGRR